MNTHPLIHEKRNSEGIVPLEALLDTHRKNERTRVLKGRSPKPNDFVEFEESGLRNMYGLMEAMHKDDKRIQINRTTRKPFPYIEHTTCVASIVANAGYSSAVIQAALGHDLKDMHPSFDFEDLLLSQLPNPDIHPDAIAMMIAATDFQSSRWGGHTHTKNEAKENAFMDKAAMVMAYPRTIAVIGADRLHNLLSFENYGPATQSRILTETIERTIPLVGSFDTVIHDALVKVANELKNGINVDLDLSDSKRLNIAVHLLQNFAEARHRNGYADMAYSFINRVRKSYGDVLKERMKYVEAIQLFSVNANPTIIEAPNLPSLKDSGMEIGRLSEIVRSTLVEANLTGKLGGINLDELGLEGVYDVDSARDIKLLHGMYPQIAWAKKVQDIFYDLVKSRIDKRIILEYFETIGVQVDETDISENEGIVSSLRNNFRRVYVGRYITGGSGENISHYVIESPINYREHLAKINAILGLDDPMVVLDTAFDEGYCKPLLERGFELGSLGQRYDFSNGNVQGVRIIYDEGGIVSKARADIARRELNPSLDSGPVGIPAPVSIRPYKVVDIIGAWK